MFKLVLRSCLIAALCLPAVVFGQGTPTASDYFNEGIQKSNAKDYTGALQAFTTAIILNPENAPSYYNRSLAKISLRNATKITHTF